MLGLGAESGACVMVQAGSARRHHDARSGAGLFMAALLILPLPPGGRPLARHGVIGSPGTGRGCRARSPSCSPISAAPGRALGHGDDPFPGLPRAGQDEPARGAGPPTGQSGML